MPLLRRFLLTKPFAPKRDPKRLKRIIRKVKELRDLVKSSKFNHKRIKIVNFDPIKLGRRVVLRRNFRVPLFSFMALHRLYRNDSLRVNTILANGFEGDATNLVNIRVRSALQTGWEERLKRLSQSTRIFPPDPNMNYVTQKIFEDFYDAHGIPNDAEKAFLRRTLRVNADTIDNWFAAKHLRLQPARVFLRMVRNSASVRRMLIAQMRDWALKKPLTRH